MKKEIFASHVMHAFSQKKVREDERFGKLPDSFMTEDIMNKRMEYVRKNLLSKLSTDFYHGGIGLEDRMYPKKIHATDFQPMILEFVTNSSPESFFKDFEEKDLILVSEEKLAISIAKKFKESIVCFYKLVYDETTLSGDLMLSGLQLMHWEDPEMMTMRIFLDTRTAFGVAAQLASVVVVGNKEKEAYALGELVDVAQFYVTNPQRLLAIPGKPGCVANKLIKEYWSFCDSEEDIRELLIKKGCD
ncbi:MAG: hypothetical protein J6S67_17740 [Methanobrevibacter sp.]|nr:hypothetical protein [Methanobrevibacter sp.]